MSIQRAILFGARDLRLIEVPLDTDTLQPDQIYVETIITALSTGTDLGNYEGRSTEVPGAPDYPRPVGYSNVGIIHRCGSAVAQWAPGQRVFSLRPHQSAYIANQSDPLVLIPEGVDLAAASLAYLTQLGVASLRQVNYQAGERVAVVGLGVIGLATVGVATAMGARVTAIANSDFRRSLALQLGATQAYLAGDAPASIADLVVLTANPWPAFQESVHLARYCGRITVLGFPGRAQQPPAFNPLDPAWFYGKQLTITGAGFSPRTSNPPHEIAFNLARNLELIFDYMQMGRLPLEKIITHRYPWHDMKQAYELALAHSKEMAAAVFEWPAR